MAQRQDRRQLDSRRHLRSPIRRTRRRSGGYASIYAVNVMTISRSKLAKLKPDPKQPWCSQCRSHTHFDLKRRRGTIGGETGESVVVFQHYYCTICEIEMWGPNEKKANRNVAFIIGSLFALVFGGVFVSGKMGFEIYFIWQEQKSA